MPLSTQSLEKKENVQPKTLQTKIISKHKSWQVQIRTKTFGNVDMFYHMIVRALLPTSPITIIFLFYFFADVLWPMATSRAPDTFQILSLFVEAVADAATL